MFSTLTNGSMFQNFKISFFELTQEYFDTSGADINYKKTIVLRERFNLESHRLNMHEGFEFCETIFFSSSFEEILRFIEFESFRNKCHRKILHNERILGSNIESSFEEENPSISFASNRIGPSEIPQNLRIIRKQGIRTLKEIDSLYEIPLCYRNIPEEIHSRSRFWIQISSHENGLVRLDMISKKQINITELLIQSIVVRIIEQESIYYIFCFSIISLTLESLNLIDEWNKSV